MPSAYFAADPARVRQDAARPGGAPRGHGRVGGAIARAGAGDHARPAAPPGPEREPTAGARMGARDGRTVPRGDARPDRARRDERADGASRVSTVMTRFSRVRAPHFRLRAVDAETRGPAGPEDLVDLDDAERMGAARHRDAQHAGTDRGGVGRPMAEGRFEFSYGAPRYARRYAEYFHAPVHFGCREAAVVIPGEWLELACPLADPTCSRRRCGASRRASAGSTGDRFLAGARRAARSPAPVEQPGSRSGRPAVAGLARGRWHAGSAWVERAIAISSKRGSGGHAEALLRDPQLGIAEVAYAARIRGRRELRPRVPAVVRHVSRTLPRPLLDRSRGETGSV